MAVQGSESVVNGAAVTATGKAADVRILLDQLGSTQRLDRERSRLKLRASLNHQGVRHELKAVASSTAHGLE